MDAVVVHPPGCSRELPLMIRRFDIICVTIAIPNYSQTSLLLKNDMMRFVLLLLALLLALMMPAQGSFPQGPMGLGGTLRGPSPPGPRDPGSNNGVIGLPGIASSPARSNCPSDKIFDQRSGKCRTIIFQ